ncbi:Thioredoxin domain-containing protein/TPR_2 domain-containing protein/TPR_8 domain-containing protein/TPR_11 domain-containing protein [Cephalotus follicularis]|uniref:Thioredoxin domain-containing protein/TPR_2 domain-containing protein/TPR_8 domain-containing protein/TPR_11 domain-containing protein n=1 Tax=Cephalotus follicularis TaxID=3775 RepID=A0A1Q3B8G8_CEPFO|nr:Thioredoxin domain-containing protein/TPR_2 domain-containing protein/TPR_8 domain-containing protein/TPR_11 domain-containing protein [Cephalotus follicularis]
MSVKPNIEQMGFVDTITDQLRDSLSCEPNKPDFRELDLGSPVSPLRPRPTGLSNTTTTTTTTTSSSSSSSGSVSGRPGSNNLVAKRSDTGPNNNSGELSGSCESSPTVPDRKTFNLKPGHARSESLSGSGSSHPLIYSGQSSTANSPPVVNVLPAGNICPSGKILKTGMNPTRNSRHDVLGSGSGNYGHGSIMRGGGGGGSSVKSGGGGGTGEQTNVCVTMRGILGNRVAVGSMGDAEEVKRAGNEQYKRGNFGEALSLYDKAIALAPGNAAYRSNRAAALTGLGRVVEAVKECEEAVRLDPNYGRAHQRLASLYLRLGQVDNARKHLHCPGQQPDPSELQKLQALEKHLSKCTEMRKVGDWNTVLRECDAAIMAGADSSPQLFMCRVEALVKLHLLEDAEASLSNIPQLEPSTNSSLQTRCFGMLPEAYLFFVQAQIEMALGRFENAVTAAEKAGHIDPRNVEAAVLVSNVRLVARARARGNDLFKSERFTEACSAYGEGLKLHPANSVLYCNRAACWFKLGLWERSIEDCNQALNMQPNYTKALLRRAASNSKLERWVDAVRDYEVLRRELPDDKEVAESLFHAQVALKKSRGEEVHNMKFGGEVEEVSGLEQFRAAISLPGISVVHFQVASNLQCKQITPFVDTLCVRYPSINFLKVDIEESPAVATAEKVRIVPTFKIYKNGSRVKEIICPSRDMLEHSVRYYSF